MTRYFALILCAALLGACTSSPKIYSDYDPSAAQRNFSTFSFFEELGTDRAGYSSLVTQHLKNAIRQELSARGYREVEGGELLVNFYVHTEEKVRVSQVPVATGYYGYRGGFYDPWGGYATETYVNQFTEGTLNIDVVDAANRRLVWQGAAVGTVRDTDRRDPQTAIFEAVGLIFAEYPFTGAN